MSDTPEKQPPQAENPTTTTVSVPGDDMHKELDNENIPGVEDKVDDEARTENASTAERSKNWLPAQNWTTKPTWKGYWSTAEIHPLRVEIPEFMIAATVPIPDEENDNELDIEDDTGDHACEDGCNCDANSSTSTVIYGQEPFETFKEKVTVLAQDSIWPGATPAEIEIERMKGGGYNRITGLTRTLPQRSHAEYKYILRQPRFFDDDEPDVERDAAILLFVQNHTSIPTPQIVHMDLSSSNAIESAYMVQNRLKGADLEAGYSSLSHEQKCQVAKELGDAYRQMLSLPSDVSGRIVLADKSKGLDSELAVTPLTTEHFHDEEDLAESVPVPYNPSAPASETVLALLTKLFKKMENLLLQKFPEYPIHAKDWISYAKMADELESAGWFKDVDYCLGHLDLEPRNVFVDPSAGGDSQTMITGLLDWDIAYLMPAFAACKPPQWIWSASKPEDEVEEDEKTANDEPPTQELQQLKQTFEDAAGAKFLRFAYEPAYRLARRLFRFAVEGNNSDVDEAQSTEMLAEWDAINDDHECDDHCNCDAVSQTSTTLYGQESFETFQDRVKTLAQEIIWPGVDTANVEVQRMTGGSGNRIIGLSRILPEHSAVNSKFILRIPRFPDQNDENSIYNDASAILFAQRHTNIPVARIIKIDGTGSNAIERPFMLQERLEGGSLNTTWDNLDHAQKCRLAKELGQIYRQMLSVRSSAPGTFHLPEDDLSLDAAVQVDPLGCFAQDMLPAKPSAPFVASDPIETVESMLTRMWSEIIDVEVEDYMIETWEGKQQMTKELCEGGWLKDVHYCLAHQDFWPRNIVAGPTSDDRSPLVQGVIDWDTALLAPAFVAAKPPHWLWQVWSVHDESSGCGHYDETGASDEPSTAEARELKSIFEEAAGETYMRFAYNPVYRMARRLFRFTMDGLTETQDFVESEELEEEWKAFRGRDSAGDSDDGES